MRIHLSCVLEVVLRSPGRDLEGEEQSAVVRPVKGFACLLEIDVSAAGSILALHP